MKLSAILAILLAAALFWGWSEHQALNQTRMQLASAVAKTPEPAPAPPASAAKPEAAAAKSLKTDASEQVAVASPTPASDFPADNPMLEKMRTMMKQPGMKAMVRAQLSAQIALDYAQFFEELGLNEEEKTALKELMLDRQMARTDLGMEMAEHKNTADTKKAMAAATQKSNAAIREFLGDEADFKRFHYYENTQPARMQFRMFGGREMFAKSAEPLTGDQEEKLVALMAKVGKQPTKPNAGKTTDASTVIETLDRQSESLRLQATDILSQAQLDTLEQWQVQRRNMTEASLEMSKAFLPKK